MIQRLIIMTSTFMIDLINTLNLLGITLILSTACTPAPNASTAAEQIDQSDSGLITPPDMEEEWSYYQGSDFYLENSHTNVIRQILFLQEEIPGVVPGFNLDSRVSERGDEETCGHPDLEDPEGRSGIDNQFATLFRLLSVIVEDTPQIAIQGAINEGRVLMMIELLGVDSFVDDDDVTLRIFRGSGRPLVGIKDSLHPIKHSIEIMNFRSPRSKVFKFVTASYKQVL